MSKRMTRDEFDAYEARRNAIDAESRESNPIIYIAGEDAAKARGSILRRGLETADKRWSIYRRLGPRGCDMQREINFEEVHACGYRGARLVPSTQGWTLRTDDASSNIIQGAMRADDAADFARYWASLDAGRRYVWTNARNAAALGLA